LLVGRCYLLPRGTFRLLVDYRNTSLGSRGSWNPQVECTRGIVVVHGSHEWCSGVL
jgi:hypothetical protein